MVSQPTPRSYAATFLRRVPYAVIFLGAFFASFALRGVIVRGGSMTPTLLPGDWVWLARGVPHRPMHKVRRGEIIVFRSNIKSHELYIKRAIGLPGDRVHLVHGNLYLNGVAIAEPYINTTVNSRPPYLSDFPQDINAPISTAALSMVRNNTQGRDVIVPPGNLFVLGDNRAGSVDSRYFGFVSMNDVVSTAKLILLSIDYSACSSERQDKGGCIWRSIRVSRCFSVVR